MGIKNFYISDLHLRHANIINIENRPFKDVEEMEKTFIDNWNKVVSERDNVYILGDFCFSKKEQDWIEILDQLKGNKILIRGNHDLQNMSPALTRKFTEISNLKEIIDNDRHVVLCHYPIIFYRKDYKENFYHLYGHVHITLEADFMEQFKDQIKAKDNRGESAHKCNFYNCWCGFYNYTPVTLDQIIKSWEEDD